jgi:cobalt-zinc-cadmium efflux system membrane fusion protein
MAAFRESMNHIVSRRRPPLVALLAIAGWSLAACFGYAWLRPASNPSRTAAAGAPGVVRFAGDAAQLGTVKVDRVETAPLALSEPLEARVVLNENVTARVFAPPGARVERLRARPGDLVRAGGALAILEPLPAARQSLVLHSPITGIVIEPRGGDGDRQPLFTISDLTRLWLIADVPEQDLGRLRIGGPANVESELFPGHTFAATLDNIAETGASGSRRIELRCVVANPGGELKPGMAVHVVLAADPARDLPRVPSSAVMNDAVGTYVFLERAPGEFVRRPVTLELQGARYSYVAQGLQGGERVVIAGAGALIARGGSRSDRDSK